MKEMMEILTENKRKEQLRRKESKRIKEQALDILQVVWIFIIFTVIFKLLCML